MIREQEFFSFDHNLTNSVHTQRVIYTLKYFFLRLLDQDPPRIKFHLGAIYATFVS